MTCEVAQNANVEVDEVDGAVVAHGFEDGEVGAVEGEAEAGRDTVEELTRRALLTSTEVHEMLRWGGRS